MRGAIIIFLLVLLLAACTEERKTEQAANVDINEDMGVGNMKLISTAFKHGGNIPSRYTCQGEDINPALKIEDVPAGAKSLALIFDDPDAQQVVGYTWVHWLVKDIPADAGEIREDSVPGAEVENDFHREDYGGPCPPSGTHRYFFRLYALDVESFDAADKDEFYQKVEEHKIGEAVLMGRYKKS